MTVQLDWPSDVVDSLIKEARRKGLSLEAYLLEAVRHENGSTVAPAIGAEEHRRRADAGARILEIQQRVMPDMDGLTSRDYIQYGRR